MRHVNVCPVYDVGEFEGLSYVVMAYIEGPSLADRLENGRLEDCRQAVMLACQVARVPWKPFTPKG